VIYQLTGNIDSDLVNCGKKSTSNVFDFYSLLLKVMEFTLQNYSPTGDNQNQLKGSDASGNVWFGESLYFTTSISENRRGGTSSPDDIARQTSPLGLLPSPHMVSTILSVG
jgi:hypothetical protein